MAGVPIHFSMPSKFSRLERLKVAIQKTHGIIPSLSIRRGRVVWLSAHAWKACNPQRFAGSNPALSAINIPQWGVFIFRSMCPEMILSLGCDTKSGTLRRCHYKKTQSCDWVFLFIQTDAGERLMPYYGVGVTSTGSGVPALIIKPGESASSWPGMSAWVSAMN